MTTLRLAAFALIFTGVTPGQNQWTEVRSPAPPARGHHEMAYDSTRARTLMLLGLDQANQGLMDMWQFSGGSWSPLTPIVTPPPARSGFALAYDPIRDRLVLFGGVSPSGSALAELWEYDGVAWVLLAPTGNGPAPRTTSCMAFDASSHRVLLFGGHDGTNRFGDTWSWDGHSWTLEATTGPSPRLSAAMACDRSTGRVALFGGTDVNHEPFADLWIWENGRWTEVPRPGNASWPGRRFHAEMAYDSLRQCLVLTSGEATDHELLNDTWTLRGTTWTEVISNPRPPVRKNFAMAFDESAGQILIHGGETGLRPGPPHPRMHADTWELHDHALVPHGVATEHCGGAPNLHAFGEPVDGNASFALDVSNAVPTFAGLTNGMVLASLHRGNVRFGCAGGNHLTLNVLPAPFSPVWWIVPVHVGPDGRGRMPLPIPDGGAAVGLTLEFQYLGNHPTTNCGCAVHPSFGASASRGLSLTVR